MPTRNAAPFCAFTTRSAILVHQSGAVSATTAARWGECAPRRTGGVPPRRGSARQHSFLLAFGALSRYHSAMARDSIDQLARRLAESLPKGLRAVQTDLEENFRGILASGLHRLDLVTREEFDVQEAVLARTRAKLEALEARLGALEDAGVSAAEKPPAAKKKAAKKKPAAKKTPSKKTASASKKPSTRKKASTKTPRSKKKTGKTGG